MTKETDPKPIPDGFVRVSFDISETELKDLRTFCCDVAAYYGQAAAVFEMIQGYAEGGGLANDPRCIAAVCEHMARSFNRLAREDGDKVWFLPIRFKTEGAP